MLVIFWPEQDSLFLVLMLINTLLNIIAVSIATLNSLLVNFSCYFPYITCIEVQISVLVWNICDIRSSMRINTVYLFALLFLKIKENANFDGFRGGGGGVVSIEFLTYLLSMLRLLSHSLVHHLLFLLLSVWCSTGADRTSACDGWNQCSSTKE